MDEKTYQLQERIRHIEGELQEVKKELRNLNNDSGPSENPAETAAVSAKSRPSTLHLKKRNPKSLEQLAGDWLPRVFIFVFILGIIWAFIAAMDRGWISPVVRVLAGFSLSGLLYWFGNRIYKRMRNALSIVLLGGSIVVYIVAVFAGNVLYDLIPYTLTLVLLAAGIVFGVWMSRRYASESLLAIIGVGAYLYPFLFAGDSRNENLFYFYETIIFTGLVLESINKQYKVTWNIANYAFMFAVLFFTVSGVGQITLVTFLVLTGQQLLIIYLTFQVHNPASKGMYISAISAGAFFLYLIGEDLFGPLDRNLYIFYALAAGAYGGLSIVKSRTHHELKNVFFVFSMFYIFIFFTRMFDEAEFIRLLTYTVQAIVIYYVAQKRYSLFGTIASMVLLSPVVYELWELPGFNFTFAALACWLLVIGFSLAVYVYRGQSIVLETSFIAKTLPYITGMLLLVFFSKISEWITYPGSDMDYNIGLSISWMAFVGVMYSAYGYFKEKHWQYIGLTFLFITLCKLILFDLATVDLAWRAVLFIGLGSIGLFISRIFYNRKESGDGTQS